jgi:hypothetical protein
VVISFVATIILLLSSWNRPSAHAEEVLADLERRRIPVKVHRAQRKGGTRKNPVNFKNAHAAISRVNESREVIWARVERDPGVLQIFPEGAVIHWPEGATQ